MLHVVLGFETLNREAPVETLYVGYDPVVARETRDSATSARTLWVRNPHGQRKVSDRIATERQAQQNHAEALRVGVAEPAPLTEEEKLKARIAELEAEKAALAEDSITDDGGPASSDGNPPSAKNVDSGDSPPDGDNAPEGDPAPENSTDEVETEPSDSPEKTEEKASAPALAGALKKGKAKLP